MSYYGAVRSIPPDQSSSLSSADVALEVRQHPLNALVTPENKEKTRKPIDPPPIVQLKVINDRQRDWLVNPFLFMNAVLVGPEDERNGQPKQLQGNQLLGQNVSSLHRLKDIDNKDGGFFVFGDISCRRTGTYRLQFNLFNYEREEVNFLGSAVSRPFKVMTAKEYPGLQESTHLSRTFSDQGVRLRLRKENRNGGVKRAYQAASEVYEMSETRPTPLVTSGGPVQSYSYDQSGRGFVKRQRSDSEYSSPHGYSTYARSAMPQYGMPSNAGYGHTQPATHGDPQPHMSSMMAPLQQNIVPGWQQSHQQYSTSVGAGMGIGSASYLGSGQPTRAQPYEQTSPIYSGRAPNEMYSSMNSLPTPTSDQSLGSAQSSIGGYGQAPPQLHNPLPSRGQPVQQYDLSNPSAQYPPQPQPYSQTTQSYQPPVSNVGYDPHVQTPMKMESQGYGDSPNIYNTPHHHTYSAPEGFSSSDLPLSSGMLNREFSGAYQPQPTPAPPAPPPQTQEPGGSSYGELPEPADLAGYHHTTKSQHPQPAAYPTPHQTSPTRLQDHG